MGPYGTGIDESLHLRLDELLRQLSNPESEREQSLAESRELLRHGIALVIELDDGKIYRKPLYLMVKPWFPVDFPQQTNPSHSGFHGGFDGQTVCTCYLVPWSHGPTSLVYAICENSLLM